MKIKDIIVESEFRAERPADFYTDQDRKIIDETAKILARDCAPYFSQHKTGQPLYRGINATLMKITPVMSVANTVANRPPVDTRRENHDVADQWFMENLGIKYRSDHVAFCTGRRVTAGVYGKLSIIVPFGDFTFCWSPIIRDMADEMPNPAQIIRIVAHAGEEGVIRSESEVREELIGEALVRGKYQTTDLTTAIESQHEIMLRCAGYYVLDGKAEYYNAIIEEMKALHQ